MNTETSLNPQVEVKQSYAPEPEVWLTLREAHERTGKSVSALRKAAKSGVLDSRREKGRTGQQIEVRAEQVDAWAAEGAPSPKASAASEMVLLSKALEQLSTMQHTAMEAIERAAKAEAKVEFLSEQLRELKEAKALSGAVAAGTRRSWFRRKR